MPNQTARQNRNPLILQDFPQIYNRCNMEGLNGEGAASVAGEADAFGVSLSAVGENGFAGELCGGLWKRKAISQKSRTLQAVSRLFYFPASTT